MKQLKRGKKYSDLHKTITINILDFDYMDIEKFHSWYHLYENDIKYRLTDKIKSDKAHLLMILIFQR